MPTIARTASVKCTCGFQGEMLFCADEDWKRDCQVCGKVLTPESKGAQRYYGDRRFAGSEQESVTEGFHPSEVKLAREHMPKSAHCIKDDGRVFFESRSEQKRFMAEQRQAREQIGTVRDALGTQEW
jgi:hypothetical protein